MSDTSEPACAHCGDAGGLSPACGYCFDPASYAEELQKLRKQGIEFRYHLRNCMDQSMLPCCCGADDHNLNLIKENNMSQQADELNQLPLFAAAALEVQEQDNVRELIDQRAALYGEPVEGFERIAKVWSGILGHEVRADQVSLCLIGLKSVRASVSPDYSDNSDDIEGYLDIFRKSVGEDMIHARTGSEYWAEKKRRG